MKEMNKNSKIYRLLFTESVKILNKELDEEEEKETVKDLYKKELSKDKD